MPQVKKGDIVAVTFLDHVHSCDAHPAVRFTVYGRIIKTDRRSLYIGSWVYTAKGRKCDHNTETFTILKSCVEQIDKLVPAE